MSLSSSASRPVRLRCRSDLVSRRHRYQRCEYWVVKDPVGLKYYRFHPEEYAILQMLDGQRSLQQIKQQYESQFSPARMPLASLQQFVGQLHKQSLVVSQHSGQGAALDQRRRKEIRRQWKQKLTGLLAIRFRGVDPQWLLDRLYPMVRWMFAPLAVVLCCLLALSALILVGVHWETFLGRLPSFHEFFGPRNWPYFALVIAVTKILHELGHGLTARHFRSECHQIGFMLLVLTPCLYCDVSDSWLLKSKWRRMAIGFAGIYVELVLAAIATFVWWFTVPGVVNFLALQVMFVCSVSTLLFNGNPLLRYDGYYILADWLEIPNLRQKASQVLQRGASRWCLGMKPPENPFLPKRGRPLFALYTVASVAYRWFILLVILLFLGQIFKPYGLQVIGHLLIGASLIGLVVVPLWKLVKFFRVPGRLHEVERKHLLATCTSLALLMAAVAFVPLPHFERCPVEIRPRDATTVYIESTGRLRMIATPAGTSVREGDVLARLENTELELQRAGLNQEANRLAMQLEQLRQQRIDAEEAAERILALQSELFSIQRQIEQREQQLAALVILAPRDGVVLPPPSRNAQNAAEQLASWSGSPLEQRNLGALLQRGDVLCQIGDPGELDAVLVIDQGQREFLTVGQPADILLDSAANRSLPSQVAAVAATELESTPAALTNAAGGELATAGDAGNTNAPLSTMYEARAPINEQASYLRPGLRGRARVHVGRRTLASRCWRKIAETVRLRL